MATNEENKQGKFLIGTVVRQNAENDCRFCGKNGKAS